MAYKSDKTAVEHALFPFQLGIIALEAISKENYYFADKAKEAFTKACEGKDKRKIASRCHRISYDVLQPMMDKTNGKINGHKFIIMLCSLAQTILDNRYLLPDYVRKCFDPFLDLEIEQEIKDEDYDGISKSAKKIASKVYSRLQELGFYLND